MADAKTRDPHRRHASRHRGISYRLRKNGERTYYVFAEGKHHRVEGDEREALLVQAELRGKIARGLRVSPDPTSFAELAEEWYRSNCPRWRESTRRSYRIALDLHLLPVFGALPLAEVTPDLIARFVAERLAAGAAGSYVAANLRPLNGVMKLALRRGLISANPLEALLPEERPKPGKQKRATWTPAMIAALIAAARELGARPGNVYDYSPIVIASIQTGVRPSELLALRWCDIDLEGALVHVRHQLCRTTKTLVPTKTEAGVRAIPIAPSFVAYLRAYRLASRYPEDEHFLFCSKKGTPLDQQNVNDRGIKPALAKAGLNRPGEPELSWYDLRHAFASLVAHHGFAAVDLAAVMGHTDARVTQQTYIHPYDEAATADRLRAVIEGAIGEEAGLPALVSLTGA